LDIAKNLGWKEGDPAAATATEETEERAEGGNGGGTGMGVSVSIISPPQVDDDEQAPTGLHGYAMRDDVAAMSAFLDSSQGLDIDARDEFVRDRRSATR
jgi:hypothetical protein